MIKLLIEKIEKMYQEKSYLKLFLYFAAVGLGVSSLTVLSCYIFDETISFIDRKFDSILIIFGAYLILYLWWKDKQEKNRK